MNGNVLVTPQILLFDNRLYAFCRKSCRKMEKSWILLTLRQIILLTN